MTPEQLAELDEIVAKQLSPEMMSGDHEEDHAYADATLVNLLAKLGMVKTIAAYQAIGKWYA